MAGNFILFESFYMNKILSELVFDTSTADYIGLIDKLWRVAVMRYFQ
jgi:hypothetical protein